MNDPISRTEKTIISRHNNSKARGDKEMKIKVPIKEWINKKDKKNMVKLKQEIETKVNDNVSLEGSRDI
jgi:hypothetical protein